jgi:hypothetical protein
MQPAHENLKVGLTPARRSAYRLRGVGATPPEPHACRRTTWPGAIPAGDHSELEQRHDETVRSGLVSIGVERVARVQLGPRPRKPINMNTNKKQSESEQRYTDAYASHYSERDYSAALWSYDQIITLYPGAPEAGYARTQIREIVKSVIPAKELLAAELELVLRYLRADAESPAGVSP